MAYREGCPFYLSTFRELGYCRKLRSKEDTKRGPEVKASPLLKVKSRPRLVLAASCTLFTLAPAPPRGLLVREGAEAEGRDLVN